MIHKQAVTQVLPPTGIIQKAERDTTEMVVHNSVSHLCYVYHCMAQTPLDPHRKVRPPRAGENMEECNSWQKTQRNESAVPPHLLQHIPDFTEHPETFASRQL